MNRDLLQPVLRAFSLPDLTVSVLDGGSINEVWRIDCGNDAFVLKRYSGEAMDEARLRLIEAAEDAARRRGVPVPDRVRTAGGDAFVLHEGCYFVAARFMPGRRVVAGEASLRASRSMGRMLARLHEAMSELPPGPAWELPSPDWIDAHLHALLAAGGRLRANSPLDETACRLIEHKLEVLSRLPDGLPPFDPHWTHRDYTPRNLLFDDHDEVCAVLDFDAVRYTSAGYEVMRCLDHSFAAWSDAGLAFFEAYAAATGMTPVRARELARLFCYVSSFSTWPMRARYLQDETYHERWREFISVPDRFWDADPEALADRLAALAASTSSRRADWTA